MSAPDPSWEERDAALWHTIDDHEPAGFVAQLEHLVSELPPGSAIGLFERGAVKAFLALALTDLGREREAVAMSLTALSQYLPRYNRSLARYAEALLKGK